MSPSNTALTTTTLIADAARVLEDSGFRAVDPSATGTWRATEARVYEDAYSVVCVAVYETWQPSRPSGPTIRPIWSS